MSDSPLSSTPRRQALPVGLAHVHYGVVVRPPFYVWDGEQFESARLEHVDKSEVAALPYRADVVIENNFVGVVADSLEAAYDAAARLHLRWQQPTKVSLVSPLKGIQTPTDALAPQAKGVSSAGAHREASHHYGWPGRMRWGEQPGWVVADYQQNQLNVWGQTTTPNTLKHDLKMLTGLDEDQIALFSSNTEAPLCATGLGRHCGDDAAIDAALLSQILACPVAVWLDERYARDMTALGLAQRMQLSAVVSEEGRIEEYSYRQTLAPSEVAAVGLWLSGRLKLQTSADEPTATASYAFNEPYVFRQETLTAHTGYPAGAPTNPTLLNVQQTFARESFIDEMARESGQDPLDFRLRHLEDKRGIELIESVARQVQWQTPPQQAPRGPSEMLRGRGVAYAQLPDREQRQKSGVRSAWIADIEVNRITGGVRITRLVVGQDAGEYVDTARLQQTLQERVLGEARPLLGHTPAFDQWSDEPNGTVDKKEQERTSLSRLTSPAIEPTRNDQLATTEPASPLKEVDFAPGVAVIANALFDATGVRFRQPPFTANRVRQALQEQVAGDETLSPSPATRRLRRRWFAAAALTTIAGSAAMAWPWKGAIAPVSRPAPTLYSAETIERGRLVAAAGDCAACHTAEGGVENVGGRAFETPFGTLYSTNITPDEATGIGQWSYAAFERAMRHGISRDGSHLYPAFPYTAFAKTSDADLQALYAYLMAQPAVSADTPANALSFPYNLRALMAGWNALYHDPTPFQPDPEQSELYNRGAYLAGGLGHCSACHTPRNAMGAEQSGERYFAGAMVDGWEAPPLNTLSRAPIPWSEHSLYDYLRHGESPLHGVASGPMAPVVAGLGELPEYDVRAIAHYVAAQMGAPAGNSEAELAEAQQRISRTMTSPPGMEQGEQLFAGACASCHVDSGLPSFNRAATSLALNTNLHSERPDNVIQSILGGVHAEHVVGIGAMPGFADSFSNTQVATLAAYLRARFAPDAPSWQQLEQRVAELRQPHHNNTYSTP
ncbi:c-type cytochrome [Vreelandella olivaria]|uniref:c-type cytochrome n=1 Tax=Vreelandella olivaria TaxID=390919 RepID=UPI00201F0ECC|nr:c-type cytochrome [Halomonas olivaria]